MMEDDGDIAARPTPSNVAINDPSGQKGDDAPASDLSAAPETGQIAPGAEAAEIGEEPGPNLDRAPETPVAAGDAPADSKGRLKNVGGSLSDEWNLQVARQVIDTVWTGGLDEQTRTRREDGAVEALIGIKPRNEIEAMLVTQLLAAHNASLECYRRAMLCGQDFHARSENLHLAGKLSRTWATLLDAFNRHRGKGSQQKVIVRHVHVHEGGQAIVGVVGGGVGGKRKKGKPCHAKQIAHAPEPAMPSPDPYRDALPVARHDERPLSDARREADRRPEGEQPCDEARQAHRRGACGTAEVCGADPRSAEGDRDD